MWTRAHLYTQTQTHADTPHVFLRINFPATLTKTQPRAPRADRRAAWVAVPAPAPSLQNKTKQRPLCVVKATDAARARAKDRTLFRSQKNLSRAAGDFLGAALRGALRLALPLKVFSRPALWRQVPLSPWTGRCGDLSHTLQPVGSEQNSNPGETPSLRPTFCPVPGAGCGPAPHAHPRGPRDPLCSASSRALGPPHPPLPPRCGPGSLQRRESEGSGSESAARTPGAASSGFGPALGATPAPAVRAPEAAGRCDRAFRPHPLLAGRV